MSSITINSSQMASVENLLRDITNGAAKALTKAINQTATTTKVQIRKKIGEQLNLTAKKIGDDISIEKANYTKLTGKVSISGSKRHLAEFAGAQTKVGTKVKVFKSQGAILRKGAFKARAASGKDLLLRRKYFTGTKRPMRANTKSYGAMPRGYRFPVTVLYGPSVPDVYADVRNRDRLEADASELLQTNLEKNIDEILRRAAG